MISSGTAAAWSQAGRSGLPAAVADLYESGFPLTSRLSSGGAMGVSMKSSTMTTETTLARCRKS